MSSPADNSNRHTVSAKANTVAVPNVVFDPPESKKKDDLDSVARAPFQIRNSRHPGFLKIPVRGLTVPNLVLGADRVRDDHDVLPLVRMIPIPPQKSR